MTEIQNGDVFIIEHYTSITELSIYLGTDDVLPSASIVSPLPNEIFAINSEFIHIDVEYENPDMIDNIYILFEVNGIYSDSIFKPLSSTIDIDSSLFASFLTDNISSNFSENVNIHLEIIDIEGGKVTHHPAGEYHDVLGPLTFSHNTITTDFLASGWHLLAPPLSGVYN